MIPVTCKLIDVHSNIQRFPVPPLELCEEVMRVEEAYVKVVFMVDGKTEAIWVRVTGYGKGTLANDPVLIPMMEGAEVLFQACHVMNFMVPTQLPGTTQVPARPENFTNPVLRAQRLMAERLKVQDGALPTPKHYH